MAKKEVKGVIKLVAPAKQANPSPPIGPILGANGVNIAEFCKQFNDATKDMEAGMPIPVIITVYTDRSFEFIMKLPPVSYFIKKALKLKLGSKKPGREFVGTLPLSEVRRIAEEKMPDLNCSTIEAATKIVAGQCRSMGVKVGE
ncbi:MAG: 50S ribosomal protein L11 [Alphaproteobacteria bacterium]|jgi:large subunit ribosomal protein L11|nr:50S ribosomal protein L11 [Alphaproteobacteria bacterium]